LGGGNDLSYITLSRAEGIGSGATVGSYNDISTVVLSSPYYDNDLSGNATYKYYITPNRNGTTSAASSIVSFYTNVMAATDLSAIFYDTSAIKVSFTAPIKNKYSTSLSYILTASGGLYSKTASGTQSPFFIQNLSSSTSYTCYITTTLDSLYTAKSDSINVRTKKDYLVMYYTFDQNSVNNTSIGNYANDVLIYDASINYASGLSTSYSKSGDQSLYCNGSNYVDLKSIMPFSVTNGFSVSIWTYAPSNYSSGLQSFFGFSTGSSSTFHMQFISSTQIQIFCVSTYINYTNSSSFYNNGWFHHVVTYNNTTGVHTYYLNGTSTNTATATMSASQTNCRLGFRADNPSGSNYIFAGAIDEVKIYAKTLSATEVMVLYNYPNNNR